MRFTLFLIATAALSGTAIAASPVAVSPSRLEFVMVAPSTGPADSQRFTITSAGQAEVAFTLELPKGQTWFSVSVSQYHTPAEVTVSVPKLLFPPAMLGEVLRITPVGGVAINFPVTLQYLAASGNSAALAAELTDLGPWTFVQNEANPPPKSIALNTKSPPVSPGNYTANTTSDGNWLTLGGAYSGQGGNFALPLTLNCVCDGLSLGPHRGSVHILMSGITAGVITEFAVFHVDVALNVIAQPSGKPVPVPASLTFDYQAFGALPASQTVTVTLDTALALDFTAEAITESGKWLTVTPKSSATTASVANPAKLTVSVTPGALAAGIYKGSIKLTPSSGTPTTLPVTLNITPAPALTVTPLALTFRVAQGGTSPPQAVQVAGGGPDAKYSVLIKSGAEWLRVTPMTGTATANPSPITVTVLAANLSAGTYTGSFVVTGTGTAQGDNTIAVSATVTGALPTIDGILHSASYQEGAVAPGEIVTIFGANIGPATLVGLALDSQGKVATNLAGVEVRFDSELAPLVYVSAKQIAAVAPYSIAGNNAAFITILWAGQTTTPYPLLVAPAAPGIFTANASGKGAAAVVNQDGSPNSPSQPAAKGEIVVLYLTGEGQTAPAGVTGKVTTALPAPPYTPAPVLPVAVRIGGKDAKVAFAGEAPSFVSGVLQLNVEIPDGTGAGDLPLTVSLGPYSSPSGVTISVR